MPSFGILRTAMFRFERKRVLHCFLYRGTSIAHSVSACIAGRQLHNQPLPASRDGNCITSHSLHRGTGSTIAHPPHKKGEAPEGSSPLHNPSPIHLITVRSTLRFPHRSLPSDSFRACRIRSVWLPVFLHSSADTASTVLHRKSDHNHDR